MSTSQAIQDRANKEAAKAATNMDQRYRMAAGMRRQMNKVFPTHWSFLLGEVALYSFVILLVTGVYLTLFFDPSLAHVIYEGPYQPLRGVEMSRAYETALQISFEVRGGLFVRQLHHWAALLFAASIILHLLRVFFTGGFRKPREANWVIGSMILVLTIAEGFMGYTLPDDLLSGIGLRITSAIMLSLPVVGTWIHWFVFGGEFPGELIIARLYVAHILLIPGLLLALIAAHLALVWYQKHTQFPGPGRTENNVVGVRVLPVFGVKAGGFFGIIFGILALMSGFLQINAIWNLGPYNASQISAGSQPDFYMFFTEGMARIWPAWDIYIGNYLIPSVVGVAVILGIVFALLFTYPFIEAKLTKDDVHHNILQRPRDVPVRTSLGAMALAFYAVLFLMAMNDIIAFKFHISLNATTWLGRLGLIVLPPVVYIITYRWCIALQRSDRKVLEHGIETGIITRLPHGEYIELHQPLGPVDEHGHPIPLPYQGAAIPKRMNQLGAAGAPGSGSLLTADPSDERELLEHEEHEAHLRQAQALRALQQRGIEKGEDDH
ncbi:cytochrome bc complex cytochrome b subunit [Hoyosella sp. G463]|uniref:Cytochrome bc1 complex cytochrome b subunit n=1 Tax=Lolliginicoccus lacisalsi TaxID=2742202 RepID=A0A927JF67_9ACTN|nr:cytochrome bc complex cytochrome b subunit [Lolliginicoccus lacisalsi]MBD8507717.1 cytochrome bc complex cytochrome b subunit [Lolliginicoccus lacisalsi]